MSRGMKHVGPALAAVLVLALCLTPAAKADNYSNGYVDGNGYTYNNGYWWKDGYAYKYERYWVAGTSYYQYGCHYTTPGYWAYKYVQYPVAQYKEPEKKVSYTDPDWRSKLLDIAGNRDKYEAQARKAAYEQKAFIDSVGALGLTGNFRWEGYGTSPYPPAALTGGYGGYYQHLSYGATLPLNGLYSHQQQLQLGSYGANASTLYGNTLKQLADPYADNNLPQLYQQANRLAENAQRLSGQATQDFGLLVKEEGGNRARVAEILARAEAVRQFMSTIDGPPKTVTETKTFEFKSDTVQVGPAAGGVPAGDPNYLKVNPQATGRKAQFEAVWKARCASCHTGTAAKAKFTLETYYKMTADEKLKVWQLLVTKDKDRVMPRTASGGPGELLTQDEVRLFTEF